jgi:hypothetical protein
MIAYRVAMARAWGVAPAQLRDATLGELVEMSRALEVERSRSRS